MQHMAERYSPFLSLRIGFEVPFGRGLDSLLLRGWGRREMIWYNNLKQ